MKHIAHNKETGISTVDLTRDELMDLGLITSGLLSTDITDFTILGVPEEYVKKLDEELHRLLKERTLGR